MRTRSWIPALVVAGALFAAPATAADGGSGPSPDVVAGTVVQVDAARSRVTVRDDDGETFEFTASAETLRDLKPGDRIEARKRSSAE
jgi:hypothetical protein